MNMNVKSYIILANNKDTESLIEHLRFKDDGMITVIDDELENGMSKKGDIIYFDRGFVESSKVLGHPFVYYHYIEPMHRKDNRKWRRSLSEKP